MRIDLCLCLKEKQLYWLAVADIDCDLLLINNQCWCLRECAFESEISNESTMSNSKNQQLFPIKRNNEHSDRIKHHLETQNLNTMAKPFIKGNTSLKSASDTKQSILSSNKMMISSPSESEMVYQNERQKAPSFNGSSDSGLATNSGHSRHSKQMKQQQQQYKHNQQYNLSQDHLENQFDELNQQVDNNFDQMEQQAKQQQTTWDSLNSLFWVSTSRPRNLLYFVNELARKIEITIEIRISTDANESPVAILHVIGKWLSCYLISFFRSSLL